MTADTPGLVAFIDARLLDDERIATAAIGNHYSVSFGDSDRTVIEHIDRWTSARVLAEVQAKRKIIEQYVEQHNAARQDIPDPPRQDIPDPPAFSPYKVGRLVGLKMAVQMLAFAYADHPDFQQAWSL